MNVYISNDAARQSATGLTLFVLCVLWLACSLVCLFACLLVCFSVCVFVWLFVCFFVCCLFVVCLFVCLFVGSRAPNARHCALHVQLRSARVLFFVLHVFVLQLCL